MEAIWKNVKSFMRDRIPGHSYRMWIEPLRFDRMDSDGMVVATPNLFSKKRVSEQYGAMIEARVRELIGRNCPLIVEVAEKQAGVKKPKGIEKQLCFQNFQLHQNRGRILRKNFTFDRFVVGGSNAYAYSASLSLASKKELNQNSLFLLSKTGMGKSHLSQAIGHHILSRYPMESVYYITAEDFTNEMVNAFRTNSLDAFKEKYRKQCDVLILEDIHFLTGKDRTQVELALSLDYLFDSNKKIIFTSCYLPVDIPKMNDQLRSRLSCALIPSIDPPDFRMRVKILQRKAREYGYVIPGEITEYLASELSENIRQLENGLVGVTTKSSLLGAPIDLNLAESVVKNMVQKKKQITINSIKKMVSKHFNISVEEMVSGSRKQKIVRPRQIAIYLSRKFTDQTLQAIGKSFNKYHATAIRSVGVIEQGVKEGGQIKEQVQFLSKKLEAGEL